MWMFIIAALESALNDGFIKSFNLINNYHSEKKMYYM
jgi:hypothetical protein